MIHLLYFITRKPGLDDDEFHRYWRDVHGPIVAQIPQLRRYLQSHVLPGSTFNSQYDGAAEAWVDDIETLAELRNEPAYLDGALADEPNFIDMSRVEWLTTRDRVIVDGPQKPMMVKTISLLRRKQGLSVEAFRAHWRDVHGPIAQALPGIRRYTQCVTLDNAYEFGEPRWDGVSEIWVDSPEALVAMRESEVYQQSAMADAENFLDSDALSVFAATEHHVIWPETR